MDGFNFLTNHKINSSFIKYCLPGMTFLYLTSCLEINDDKHPKLKKSHCDEGVARYYEKKILILVWFDFHVAQMMPRKHQNNLAEMNK